MNYSEINDDLINNRDFYLKVLARVPKHSTLNVNLDIYGIILTPQETFERRCAYVLGSIFTAKYGFPLDLLVEHLEQINWNRYIEI